MALGVSRGVLIKNIEQKSKLALGTDCAIGQTNQYLTRCGAGTRIIHFGSLG
jgi:hypothetical protein